MKTLFGSLFLFAGLAFGHEAGSVPPTRDFGPLVTPSAHGAGVTAANVCAPRPFPREEKEKVTPPASTPEKGTLPVLPHPRPLKEEFDLM